MIGSIIYFIIMAIIAYVVADKIGRNKITDFAGSFAIVLILGLIGLAIVYFLPDKDEEEI